MQHGISDLCGDKAGAWVHQVELAIFSQALEDINCQRGQESTKMNQMLSQSSFYHHVIDTRHYRNTALCRCLRS